jgi:hypothetical protein
MKESQISSSSQSIDKINSSVVELKNIAFLLHILSFQNNKTSFIDYVNHAKKVKTIS